MINDHIREKIQNSIVINYPYPHMIIDNILTDEFAEKLHEELMLIEMNESPDNDFSSNYGKKMEYKREIPSAQKYNQIREILSGSELSDCIAEKFNLSKLEGDPSFDGGGYVISPKNSFLRYHADFNFSSKVNKYRIVNLILYMNRDYSSKDGGCLHLLDYESKTVESEVKPIFNRAVIFLTNEKTVHGVNRNNGEFQRRSFNTYFYSETPLLEGEITPHKTLWV